jgi:uncharacterized membrane protein
MYKTAFLEALRQGLSALPRDEAEERLTFYAEMIDDGMEEGLSEEEAVAAVGSVDEIVSQAVSDAPRGKLPANPAKEPVKTKRRLRAWEIVLLALGSPVWLSLLLAAFAVVLALYLSLWSVVISLWAVFASLIGCTFAGVVGGIVVACFGNVLSGIALIGAGLACAGLSIFLFFGCKVATVGTVVLAKKSVGWTKRAFVKREDSHE